MKLSIIKIIKEEIENYFSDWQASDTSSIADKYYNKYFLTDTTPYNEKVDAEVAGYVSKDWSGRPLENPIPIYKNPKSLTGIDRHTRGIVVKNGDFYIAKDYRAAHNRIIEKLADLGIIPQGYENDYMYDYPSDFVAVQRFEDTDRFAQSDAYRMFPEYYTQIFAKANTMHPYKFQQTKIVDE